MYSKIKKLLYLLEDPEHPCLGPVLTLLRFTGLWHSDLKPLKSRLKLVLFYVIISFFFTQYFKCIIFFNSASLKLILQYAPFHMGILKTCYFQKDYKSWEELVQFISEIERKQTTEKDPEKEKITQDYIQWSRRVTYFFILLAFFSNITIFAEPFQKNMASENGTAYLYVFDGYTPFRREPPGYYFSMFIQTVIGYVMSMYIISWDMTTISIMIFFVGQLRISSLYCSRVIDKRGTEYSQVNIAECHEFHMMLVTYQRKFNALISSVMFFYLIIISVNLGVCIKQLAELEDDLPTFVSSCVYIIACLIQLLLFYWHSNEVIIESERVSYSTFKSDWVDANCRLQRQVALLACATSKRLTFRAGPFSDMSLSTFINILRRSYSFYTLLKGTN